MKSRLLWRWGKSQLLKDMTSKFTRSGSCGSFGDVEQISLIDIEVNKLGGKKKKCIKPFSLAVDLGLIP